MSAYEQQSCRCHQRRDTLYVLEVRLPPCFERDVGERAAQVWVLTFCHHLMLGVSCNLCVACVALFTRVVLLLCTVALRRVSCALRRRTRSGSSSLGTMSRRQHTAVIVVGQIAHQAMCGQPPVQQILRQLALPGLGNMMTLYTKYR